LDAELLGRSLGRGRSIRACQPRCLLPLSGPLRPPFWSVSFEAFFFFFSFSLSLSGLYISVMIIIMLMHMLYSVPWAPKSSWPHLVLLIRGIDIG
jgi:hypothetical protein